MDSPARFTQLQGFATDWRRLLTRGTALLFFGIALAVASLFNPDATLLHARDFSWLPAAAILVVAAGVIECFDAAIARNPTGFFVHLPIGVLDLVNGSLIVMSIGLDPPSLRLMIAAFLIVKGTLRIALARTTHLPHMKPTIYGGAASILFGLLIWQQWPASGAWFMAFGLSADIALRGWATMMFALWLRQTDVRGSTA